MKWGKFFQFTFCFTIINTLKMARYQHPFAMSMGLHPKFEEKIFFGITSTGSISKSSIIIDLQYLTIYPNE